MTFIMVYSVSFFCQYLMKSGKKQRLEWTKIFFEGGRDDETISRALFIFYLNPANWDKFR